MSTEATDRYAWLDPIIEEQRRVWFPAGDYILSLIEAAAEAQEVVDIEELDQGRDSSAR